MTAKFPCNKSNRPIALEQLKIENITHPHQNLNVLMKAYT